MFGRDIGLKAYVVCELLEIVVPNVSKNDLFEIKLRRFYRSGDISSKKAYDSHIQ